MTATLTAPLVDQWLSTSTSSQSTGSLSPARCTRASPSRATFAPYADASPLLGASMLRYAAIPVRVFAYDTSRPRHALSVNGRPPLMPTMTKPGWTAGIPSGPHCGHEMSTPHPADRCVAVFTADTVAAGDFAGDDGCAVAGAIAAGSEPPPDAGFGGDACDGTFGSCTTAIAMAATSTTPIETASNRHHPPASGRIAASALQLRQHLRKLVEQLPCEVSEPADPRRKPLARLGMQVRSPHGRLLRGRTACGKPRDSAGQHVTATRRAEAAVAALVHPGATVRRHDARP